MGAWIFFYVFFIWGILPFNVFEYPSKWFKLTWAVWVISQIIILLVLRKMSRRRASEGRSTKKFMPYIMSTCVMLLISLYIPTAAGGVERMVIGNYATTAEEEMKAQLEAELPELIRQLDNRIVDINIDVEHTVPDTRFSLVQTSSAEERKKTEDYCTFLIKVEAKTEAPNGYISPANVQKLYQEIYNKRSDIRRNSRSYERYEAEWRKYKSDKHVNIGQMRDGILLKAECPGYSYTAESNSDLVRTDPDDYAHKITDEISGKIWYFENGDSVGLQQEEIEAERRRKAKEEAAAAEAEEKEREKAKSSLGSSYIYGGGLDAYDKGYEDVDIDGEYDEYRYEHDLDYASGVDDAMEDREEWY